MHSFHVAQRLHNPCAYSRWRARNFVNDLQGYRTVKGSRRMGSFEMPVRIHSVDE
jgi:hypothetical protein